MAVIGRLDDQVDSVLIAPLDRNRRGTAEAQEEEQQQPENRQPASSQMSAPASDETKDLQNEQAEREELPVWLL
ncbi:MAG TPA: hypothetical protein VF658_16165 [Pyrinomonadaceae bacterium]|jgi:hypothetical protein